MTWEWEYHPDFPDKVIALRDGERDVLLCTGDDGRAWGEILPAYARLIRASPALLEALSEAVCSTRTRYLEACEAADVHNNMDGAGQKFDYKSRPTLPGWVTRAEAIIAKAEGR